METNTSSQKAELVAWLSNANAMEMGLIEVLKNHARDARNLPRVQERIQQHIEQTRLHAQRVQQAISLCGASVSVTKSWLGDIFGRLNALSTAMHNDALVKNTLMDFASEQFEIACYRSLITAAEALHLVAVAELCRKNLEDEVAMARWLEEFIPEATRMHLQQQSARAAA